MAEIAPDVWTRSKVQALISTNDKAVIRALLAVYAKQTEAEKQSDHTHCENGVGFSKFDAELLTSFAKQYNRAGFLSEKQMSIARRKMASYWRQLLDDIKAKGLPVCYTRTK